MRIKRAVSVGVTPIYCIGKTQSEHAAGDAKLVIEAQLLALLDLDKASLEKVKSFGLVIAYEPIWAMVQGKRRRQRLHKICTHLYADYLWR